MSCIARPQHGHIWQLWLAVVLPVLFACLYHTHCLIFLSKDTCIMAALELLMAWRSADLSMNMSSFLLFCCTSLALKLLTVLAVTVLPPKCSLWKQLSHRWENKGFFSSICCINIWSVSRSDTVHAESFLTVWKLITLEYGTNIHVPF